MGPWEFSPYNPIAHTRSRDDRWLSVGHGRLVDTPDGKWYMTVHAYENGYRTLGRQMLLLPIEWTADGWFRVPPGITADSAIPMPIPGTVQQPFADPSDDFTTPELACSGVSGASSIPLASRPETVRWRLERAADRRPIPRSWQRRSEAIPIPSKST